MNDRASQGRSIFERMGVRPLINACGVYTDLGGSIVSPTVWAAMQEVNGSFVSMVALLEQTGRILADLVGAEDARVTPGASAAIALGTAACLTGMNGDAWESLPDTTGMRNEFLIQRGHRFKYDRCARLAGAKLVEVGEESGTTTAQIAAAITPRTAMILFPAHLEGRPGTVALATVAEIGHDHGVPTLVDAAYQSDPPELMLRFTAEGADLVVFSAKYYRGPNAGGFICGRADLIRAVAGVDFTRYESGLHRTFGRAFKLDRQIVVAVVVALQEWFTMDHKARWAGYRTKVDGLIERLAGVPGISAAPMAFTLDERLVPTPVNCAAIRFHPGSGHTPDSVCRALAEGSPSVAATVLDGALIVAMDTIQDGEDVVVAGCLRGVLGADR